MENKLPTAEEFLKRDESGVYNEQDIAHAMIEFAKIHVETALKKAADQANMNNKNAFGIDITSLFTSTERGGHGMPDLYSEVTVNKDSILNAYSLTNIK